MIPIPAQRFYGLLGLGMAIALLLATLVSGSLSLALAFLVLWDLAIALLTLLDSRRVQRVDVTRLLEPRLSIGRENTVTLQVKTGKTPAIIQLADHHPRDIAATALPLRLAIPAQSLELVSYSVTPRVRCELSWGHIQVRQLGPWQLAWHPWSIDQPQTTKVYPDLVALRELTIRLALESSGSLRTKLRRGMGTEFSELREYASGDDPRLIDWKATARRGRPLVRVLEPEQEQSVLILLDRGRLMTAQVMGLQRFDWGVNAALSLALAALHRGDRVGLGVFDRKMHLWIPPDRGTQHLPQILERLSPIQPVLQEPDYLGAVGTLIRQQTRRALVVLITDIVDVTASGELLGALGRLSPRYLPFCVTLRDPQLDRLAARQDETRATEIDQAFRRSVALDLLNQRQLAFAQLKQQGVLVLDAPASSISNRLVDEYLRIKRRNRL